MLICTVKIVSINIITITAYSKETYLLSNELLMPSGLLAFWEGLLDPKRLNVEYEFS